MELNQFQIVGALAQPPRPATTQNGTQILELVLENQASDGYNGAAPKTETISVNLTGDFRQYQALKVGQVLLVAGTLGGTMATSQNGQYCKIRLRPKSITILPYERPLATPIQQDGFGFGQPRQQDGPQNGYGLYGA